MHNLRRDQLEEQDLDVAQQQHGRRDSYVNVALVGNLVDEGRVSQTCSPFSIAGRDEIFQRDRAGVPKVELSIAVHKPSSCILHEHLCSLVRIRQNTLETQVEGFVRAHGACSDCLVNEGISDPSKNEHGDGEPGSMEHGSYDAQEQQDGLQG